MLKDLWIVMLVLGFVCLFISLLLFFVWKVPDLMDEISGRKAARQIRLMKDMSKSTGAFSGLSTSEVYMSIPSGSLLSEELGSIRVGLSTDDSFKEELSDDDIATSDISENSKTSYMSEDVNTSYIDETIISKDRYSIKILEEHSSLG